jgi:subtilisin-like proprotein convertase family protein
MKKNLLLTAVVALTLTAKATLYSYDFTSLNTAIPDGNPVGLANSQTINLGTLPLDGTTTSIVNVDVRLNISGGYNGDLYGYLVLQSADSSTTTAILLNRIGQVGGDFGNSGAGINVTLSGSGATDIHNAAFGSVTGTYQPDGGTTLAALNGVNANGTWTLFLADLSGGDTATLVSWGVDISVVPEPVTWALLAFAAVAVGRFVYRRQTVRA